MQDLEKYVWLLKISSRYGDVCAVFSDCDRAEKSLLDYCKENWCDTMGSTQGLSDDDIIHTYFDAWEDGREYEEFTLDKVLINGGWH